MEVLLRKTQLWDGEVLEDELLVNLKIGDGHAVRFDCYLCYPTQRFVQVVFDASCLLLFLLTTC